MKPNTSPNPRAYRSCLFKPGLLLLLAALPLLSGCLVIEKKTLVLVIPPDSPEVRMFYVYEGLSCLDDKQYASLKSAQRGLEGLKENDLSFFIALPEEVAPLLWQSEQVRLANEIVKLLWFKPLRFYRDPTRERSLCAYRSVTLTDRKALAKMMNDAISESFRKGPSPEVMLENIKKSNRDQAKHVAAAEQLGMGALIKTLFTLGRLAEKFDVASLKAMKDAAKEAYPWLKFEPDTIRLTFPITADCARKIVADPDAATWLKELRSLVEPVKLEAGDQGLSIVLGAKDQPIQLRHTDPRPHFSEHKVEMHRQAGNPQPVLLEGKPADAARLIEVLFLKKPAGVAGLPLLLDLLKSLNRDTRRQAAEELGALGPAAKAAVPALRDALGASSAEVRAAAAAALKKIDPTAAAAALLPLLLNELKSPQDRYTRCQAAEELGALGPAAKAAVPALRDALGDITSEVRAAAAAALKKIDPMGAK